MKITNPPTSPTTTPCTTAFRRTIRVRTMSSSRLSSVLVAAASSAAGRGARSRSEVLKELPHELSLGPSSTGGHVDEDGGVAEESRTPPSDEAGGEAVEQPEQTSLRGHRVPREVLAEQGQARPHDLAVLHD